MDEKAIRKYAALMQELDLSALEIAEDGKTLRLERNVDQPVTTVAVPAMAAVGPTAQLPQTGENTVPGLESVCSPMVGVFYSAPAEDAEPFVKVGDQVHQGDVLCIIEAMKLMNEITSEYDGTVVEVCVTNGQVVDFGRVIFRIQKEQA